MFRYRVSTFPAVVRGKLPEVIITIKKQQLLILTQSWDVLAEHRKSSPSQTLCPTSPLSWSIAAIRHPHYRILALWLPINLEQTMNSMKLIKNNCYIITMLIIAIKAHTSSYTIFKKINGTHQYCLSSIILLFFLFFISFQASTVTTQTIMINESS